MEYDDNVFQGKNLQLAAEGCSKLSSVLHPYTHTRFEFNDSLQEDLRFDKLEVFLQEDNQWIEEYSRGSSGAVESIHKNVNVWSAGTCRESVEILVTSVGQEEKVVTETIMDIRDCDETGKNMDPNLNEDDGKQAHVTGGELNLTKEKVDDNKETNKLADEVVTKGEGVIAGKKASDGCLNEKEVESSDQGETNDEPKSPIFGVQAELGSSSQAKNPSSLVEKEAVDSTSVVENQIEIEPENTNTCSNMSETMNKSNEQVVMESAKKETSDDVEGNIQPVCSSNNATQEEEKSLTTFQVTMVPKMKDSSSRQVKKPRRKSKVEKSSLEVKSNEKAKLPDLNNSTAVPVLQFQQPFSDNQQVQLRAQILVYGSLISGSAPEEAHMIAALGPSSVYLQRLKSQNQNKLTTCSFQAPAVGINRWVATPAFNTPPLFPLTPNLPGMRKKPQITAPLGMLAPNPVNFLFHQPQPAASSDDGKVMSEESLRKVEESKIEAVVGGERAAAAVTHCHGVWSQLERLNYSPDDEAKLVSAAVSVAAATCAAKVAAAAAKIASDLAQSFVNNVFDSSEIVKAAELAAEAVSHAGKVVAMSEPFPLTHLVEAGPQDYWKSTPNSSLINQNNFNENHKEVHQNNNKRKPRVRKGRHLSKTIPESETACLAGQTDKDNNDIKEGCLVEVYKEDDKYNGAWFGARVLSMEDGKALVCYTEGQLKDWVALEVGSNEVPKIRVAHLMPRVEGGTDFVWFSGDLVDVWIQDRWREGVVLETNPSCVTVKFLGEAKGKKSVVGSWFVRPTLFWKDGKWVQCHTSSQTQEKQKKLESSTQTSIRKKEGPGVVFGVPKPGTGKKQKFMDVSKHYVGVGNDSVNFTKYLIPQAPPKEKQSETKPRKPPVPSFRSLTSNTTNKTTTNDNQSDQDFDTRRVNKRKFVSGKEEEAVEPSRRSNRKIQPTSRLLEGLQTSITISKTPSHFTHTKRQQE